MTTLALDRTSDWIVGGGTLVKRPTYLIRGRLDQAEAKLPCYLDD